MKTKKIIVLILITTSIGLGMLISSVSNLFGNITQLLFFVIGLGLLIGPMYGMILSVLDKSNNNKKQ